MPLPCTNFFLAISYKKRFSRLYKTLRMATLAYILLMYHHKEKKADVTGRGQDTKHHKCVTWLSYWKEPLLTLEEIIQSCLYFLLWYGMIINQSMCYKGSKIYIDLWNSFTMMVVWTLEPLQWLMSMRWLTWEGYDPVINCDLILLC